MENQSLKKGIVLLLLLNRNNVFKDSYSLIKVLSRWFKIIDFNLLIDEMINENLLEELTLNQIGNYSVTSKGMLTFSNQKVYLEELLKQAYPTQVEIINILFNNIINNEDL